MRSLSFAILLAVIATPAAAEMQCLRFQDVASSGVIELSEDWETATYRFDDKAITVQLVTCGNGLVGRCAKSEGDPIVSNIVPVHGWLYGKGDEPAKDFLIVDGAGMFEAGCDHAG